MALRLSTAEEVFLFVGTVLIGYVLACVLGLFRRRQTPRSVPYLEPLHLGQWAEANEHLLVPPVCNKLVFGEGTWKAMVVGGSNQRADYHIEEGEEFFLQLRGSMCLKLIERGAPRDVMIREGEMFLLPARIPHSPNRLADTVGFVMERARREGEVDGLRYYTADFGRTLYEEWFHCADLGKDLKPVIDRFNASEAKRSGVPERDFPLAPVEVDETTAVGAPVPFAEWLDAQRTALGAAKACTGRPLFERGAHAEFAVDVYWGACASEACARGEEAMLFQQAGVASVRVRPSDGSAEERTLALRAGEVMLVPQGHTYALAGEGPDCVGLEFYLQRG
ncbi:3-hydroxyanthranilic acid dioxygenase-domain-containing protein [Pavlovales sp. CCMP2436]|nr:3-hydroxyanthranilic acid dioxygenase-domain-containing protein [Pavlovales sp. CCMP2436]|mmetsp:Transcript_35289/g.88015  ORF Transcript_35289/g.88015 Transcript_35289/m.88015 type:complete len:336 (+) Transcript_35289:62-1069(+)|eukprot:CAMPEP_0179873458 /NCGR_PEP_ID=MMETSP0982-20121206/22195_1 /TAXON_ID=483367 /ORGANISM="non described non described, Strain CCMP 2436" /LENGTH=335 /DNA_ID=CAMNT_0021764847 /DNA_START=30 /DNA_END=1037 /DNA_ORIENTATION=-